MQKNQMLSKDELAELAKLSRLQTTRLIADAFYGRLLQLCQFVKQCDQYTGDGSPAHIRRANRRDGQNHVGVAVTARSSLWCDYSRLGEFSREGVDVSMAEIQFLKAIRQFLDVPQERSLLWVVRERGFRDKSYPVAKSLIDDMQQMRRAMELLCLFCIDEASARHREATAAIVAAAKRAVPKESVIAALTGVWHQALSTAQGIPDWASQEAVARICAEAYDSVMNLKPQLLDLAQGVEAKASPIATSSDPMLVLDFLSQEVRAQRQRRFDELLAVHSLIWGFENRHPYLAHLSNVMAKDVLGWHVSVDDPRKLWRNPDGTVVCVQMSSGSVYKLCQHPWRSGVNADEDISYSPAHNHHRREIDWMEWTKRAIGVPALPT